MPDGESQTTYYDMASRCRVLNERPNGSTCTYWANITYVLNTIQKPKNLSLDGVIFVFFLFFLITLKTAIQRLLGITDCHTSASRIVATNLSRKFFVLVTQSHFPNQQAVDVCDAKIGNMMRQSMDNRLTLCPILAVFS